jgi:hypothetical protein
MENFEDQLSVHPRRVFPNHFGNLHRFHAIFEILKSKDKTLRYETEKERAKSFEGHRGTDWIRSEQLMLYFDNLLKTDKNKGLEETVQSIIKNLGLDRNTVMTESALETLRVEVERVISKGKKVDQYDFQEILGIFSAHGGYVLPSIELKRLKRNTPVKESRKEIQGKTYVTNALLRNYLRIFQKSNIIETNLLIAKTIVDFLPKPQERSETESKTMGAKPPEPKKETPKPEPLEPKKSPALKEPFTKVSILLNIEENKISVLAGDYGFRFVYPVNNIKINTVEEAIHYFNMGVMGNMHLEMRINTRNPLFSATLKLDGFTILHFTPEIKNLTFHDKDKLKTIELHISKDFLPK